ncbi:unnamed protein product [Caenorhabditis bovis]|uniref:PDZ domain-containing protein n=1 Tax=Caenorhabditis bovis TaxID=2654633 RepID=A0A8S1EUJ4_9PELO|nr:unnamed protein product [Caenorhabditis bovis]
MSASSTSSASSSTSPDENEKGAGPTCPTKLLHHSTIAHTFSNSSMSTLDRSQYQHLSISGARRVTVQFGAMRIVVPWKESNHTTVRQLAEQALIRYKKARGLAKNDESIRVLRLECASDGGILDMDDELDDVFDIAFDQILAITDEPPSSSEYATVQRTNTSQHHYAQPIPASRRDEHAHLTQIHMTPTVSAYGSVSINASPYGHQSRKNDHLDEPLRSSLRKEGATPPKRGVTLSPDVEKRIEEKQKPRYEKNPGRLHRGSDRKSRINDAFLDARDRLAESLDAKMSLKTVRRAPLIRGPLPNTTIVTLDHLDASEAADPLGIEINAVYDDVTTPSTSKLSAVQIMRIEEGGRVARDGRIQVGDNLVEINGKPVGEMSILRARDLIAKLAARVDEEITLTIGRSLESFNVGKPIFSALQQANNTKYIGQTTLVELVKSTNGFGFTVTGRETVKGEKLFYIGTVKPNGVALGHLKSGDRLLELNGQSTATMTQAEIVEKLKETMVGGKARFLVSRVAQSHEPEPAPAQTTSSAAVTVATPEPEPQPPQPARFNLVIPLNDTGSAGLGVSLKARVSVKSDGSRHDCGIFIKNVMHGGAAFKDGRLAVNDRIVAIEEIDLERMSNAEASEQLTRKLKSIGPTSAHVKLTVIRDPPSGAAAISRDASRITVDAPSPSPSSRISSGSLLPSPHSAASSSNSLKKRESVASDATRIDDSEVVPPDADPFDREAPGRKSLSEKRGLGAASDPQHIKLFQDIKHQRQNSAPPTSRPSEKRSRSQPRTYSQRVSKSPKTPDGENLAVPPLGEQLLHRKSQSMESINRPADSVLRGTAVAAAAEHPFPPGGSPLMRLKSTAAATRADKSRRKSVGDAMRSFFGFAAAKSRDSSPEKAPKHQRSVSPPRRAAYADPYGDPYLNTPNDDDCGIQLISYTPRRDDGGGGDDDEIVTNFGNSRFYSSCRDAPDRTRYRHTIAFLICDTLARRIPFLHAAAGYESYADAELYDRYSAHRYLPAGHHAHFQQQYDDDYLMYAAGPSAYGLSAYHDIPIAAGGSVSSASLRRAYAQQQQQQQLLPSAAGVALDYDESRFGTATRSAAQHHHHQRRQRAAPTNAANGDYYRMFNSWFAYTGGGGIGAAPIIKQSPVRIAAANGIRDREAATRLAGSGSSSSRVFIPRHAGGIAAAAAFAGYHHRSGGGGVGPSPTPPPERASPAFRRRDTATATAGHRFPQFPIASSSMRMSASSRPLAMSENRRSANIQTPERLSLRARKKLQQHQRPRSEFYVNSENSSEILLPPSTSSIMSTSESFRATSIPILRQKS